MNTGLKRTLGVFDAVVVGLGAMVGAGIFAALAPAAGAAGPAGGALLTALAVAALIAYCNAWSSARLAARYPASGGTYVYGRERLGPFWGYLAGWGFVIGKTASCAAMALTVGAYVWPGQQRALAVAAVVALTAASYGGVQKSARIARLIVAAVLAVLAGVVVVCLTSGAADAGRLGGPAGGGAGGLLQAAGLLFFAFAGYARITTLGEEVRDPERTIPRAVPLALGIALFVYAAVAVAALSVLGADALAASTAPLADAVRAAGRPGLTPVVRAGAALAALGSLLALVLGVSRTTLAMARDGHLPARWPPYTPGTRCRTVRSSLWVRWSRCSRRPPICGARSASPPSECWPTTRSRTLPRGLSIQVSRAGPWQRSGCPAVSCWPARCPRVGGRGGCGAGRGCAGLRPARAGHTRDLKSVQGARSRSYSSPAAESSQYQALPSSQPRSQSARLGASMNQARSGSPRVGSNSRTWAVSDRQSTHTYVPQPQWAIGSTPPGHFHPDPRIAR